MSAARSNVRALLGLVLLACMFAAVTILAERPEPKRCLRSHPATVMQPVFTPSCAGQTCTQPIANAGRLRVVGFVRVPFEACDAWENEGSRR